jgi:uncharacterized membrane protein
MTAIKLIHIVLAIVAVGANVTYGVWMTRAKREPEHLGFALRGVKFIDDFIANPCYVLLPLTGITLMWRQGYTFDNAHWAGLALILWVLLAVVALGVYSPTLRGQIRALESEGVGSAALKSFERRAQIVGPLLGVIALAIVYLMVAKPSL